MLISKFVTKFYGNLYSSNFNPSNCNFLIDKVKKLIPVINGNYKTTCDSKITIDEVKKALFSMKKCKSPGLDGLSVEFYLYFWEYIKDPLFGMYNECIEQKEMITTMKQGIVSLIPKSGKDTLLIENWRPITLLTTDYKILALIYANRFGQHYFRDAIGLP